MLTIDSFGAGLWSNYNEEDIPDQALSEATNLAIDKQGQISRRNGTAAYSVTTDSTDEILAMCRFYAGSSNSYFVYSSKDYIYEKDESGPVYSWTTTSDDDVPTFAQFEGLLIGTNGNSGQSVIATDDGSSWSALGLSAPTGFSLAEVASGGALADGTHEYRITKVDSYGHESGPYPDFLSASAAHQIYVQDGDDAVAVSGISGASGYETRLYRRGPDTGGVFYLVEELASGVTSVTDTGDLRDVWLERLDANDPPSGCEAIAVHQDRAWLASNATHETRVWYSAAGNPQNWSKDRWFQVDDEAGGVVKMQSFGGALILFCPRGIFALVGDAPGTFEDPALPSEQPWRLVPIIRGRGTVSPRTVQEVGGRLWYLDTSGSVYYVEQLGAYQFSTASLGDISLSDQIADQFEDWSDSTSRSGACAVTYKDRYYLSIADTESYNDITLVCYSSMPYKDGNGWTRLPWVKWDVGYTSFCVFSGEGDEYRVYGSVWDTTNGTPVRLESGDETDKTPTGTSTFTASFSTKAFNIGDSWADVQARRLWGYWALTGDLTLDMYFDGRKTWSLTDSVSTSSNTKWDLNTWDELYWASDSSAERTRHVYSLPFRRCVGTIMQLKGSDSTTTTEFDLSRIAISYYVRREGFR